MLICRATHVYLQLKWRYVLLELESTNKHWEVIKMTRYREILRLSSMGLSQRSIASSCQCSRNTVSNVLSLASQKGLTWPLPEDIGDTDLKHMLFPEKSPASSRRIPDCEYIHRELAKSGVTLSLLWSEYCECLPPQLTSYLSCTLSTANIIGSSQP